MIRTVFFLFVLFSASPLFSQLTYEKKESDYRKATIRIHFDRNSPSAIMLPIMKK